MLAFVSYSHSARNLARNWCAGDFFSLREGRDEVTGTNMTRHGIIRFAEIDVNEIFVVRSVLLVGLTYDDFAA